MFTFKVTLAFSECNTQTDVMEPSRTFVATNALKHLTSSSLPWCGGHALTCMCHTLWRWKLLYPCHPQSLQESLLRPYPPCAALLIWKTDVVRIWTSSITTRVCNAIGRLLFKTNHPDFARSLRELLCEIGKSRDEQRWPIGTTSHLTSHFTSSRLHSSHFAFYPQPE